MLINEKMEDVAQFIINESKHWQDGKGAFDLANALKEFIKLYLVYYSVPDKVARKEIPE